MDVLLGVRGRVRFRARARARARGRVRVRVRVWVRVREPFDVLLLLLLPAVGLEPREVGRVLGLEVEPEEEVVPHVVLRRHMLLEVEAERLEVLALDGAHEARVQDVQPGRLARGAQLGERVDDDAW